MATCAQVIPQPDGTLLLALDPAQTNPASCAYAIASGSELGWSFFQALTVEDSKAIALAICLVWASVWGIRQVRNAFFTDLERKEDE